MKSVNKIHRDIKPSNILVNEKGRLSLDPISFSAHVTRPSQNLWFWNKLQYHKIRKTTDCHWHAVLLGSRDYRESRLWFAGRCVGAWCMFCDSIRMACSCVDFSDRNGGRRTTATRRSCTTSDLHDTTKSLTHSLEPEPLVCSFEAWYCFVNWVGHSNSITFSVVFWIRIQISDWRQSSY
jgi:serine/threonine protein kinase